MAINYSTVVKTARLNAVVTAADAGAGFAVLVIGTSALSGATGVLATLTLSKPCATVSGAVLTLAGLPKSAIAAAAGTAALAEIRDSTGVVIVSGITVGTSATDIVVNSTAVAVGQTIQLSTGTITHA